MDDLICKVFKYNGLFFFYNGCKLFRFLLNDRYNNFYKCYLKMIILFI